MTNLHNRIDDPAAVLLAEGGDPRKEDAPGDDGRGIMDRLEGNLLGGSGKGPAGSGGRKPPSRVSWLYFLLACALVGYMAMSMGGSFQGGSKAKELSTSEFVTAVKDDRVDSVVYTVMDGTMTGEYWPTDTAREDKNLVPFTSTYVLSLIHI